jgi:hypothetical protein
MKEPPSDKTAVALPMRDRVGLDGLRRIPGGKDQGSITQGSNSYSEQFKNSPLVKGYTAANEGAKSTFDVIVTPEDVAQARAFYEELGARDGMAPIAALGATLSGPAFDFYREAQTDPLNLVGGQIIRGPKMAQEALGAIYPVAKIAATHPLTATKTLQGIGLASKYAAEGTQAGKYQSFAPLIKVNDEILRIHPNLEGADYIANNATNTMGRAAAYDFPLTGKINAGLTTDIANKDPKAMDFLASVAKTADLNRAYGADPFYTISLAAPDAYGATGKIAAEKMQHLAALSEDYAGIPREMRKVLGDKPHISHEDIGGPFSAASENTMQGEGVWDPVEDFLKDMGLADDRELAATNFKDILSSMRELSANPAERVYADKMLKFAEENPKLGTMRLGEWRAIYPSKREVKVISDDGTFGSRHLAHAGAGKLLTKEIGSRVSPIELEPMKGYENPMFGLRELINPSTGLPPLLRGQK